MPHQDSQGRWISDDNTHYWDGRSWIPIQASPLPPPPPPKSGCGRCLGGCLGGALLIFAVLGVIGFIGWNNPDVQRYLHRAGNQYQAVRYDQVVADQGSALQSDVGQFANCDQQDLGCRHAKAQAVLADIKNFRAALNGVAVPGCMKAGDTHLRAALADYEAFFKVAATESSAQDEVAVASRLQDGSAELGPAMNAIATGSNCTGTA